jgi:hypothetical protein
MQCGHEGCTCSVAQADGFCSDHCREHAGDTGHDAHACECGHPECEGAAAPVEGSTERDLQEAFE